MNESEFLTTEDLATLCKTTPASVRYWRHTGYGPPGFRVGRRTLYPRNAVNAWLDALRRRNAD